MIASPLNPLYRLWKQVELFCRRLTSCALVGPLVCRSSEDVPTRFLATVVAVLLMHLHTGCRPGKYPFAPLSQVGADAATLAKVPPVLRERAGQSELARPSAARRREWKGSQER